MRIELFLVFLFYTQAMSAQDYDISMMHPKMDIKIGYPAFIKVGGVYPTFNLSSHIDGDISGSIRLIDKDSISEIIPTVPLFAGQTLNFYFDDYLDELGSYKVEFEIKSSDGQVFYESFYFKVFNPGSIKNWHSNVVYPDNGGKLKYSPDFRGNHIPDFSFAGYKEGGVEIPNIPTRIILEPYSGDNTQIIQKAIDSLAGIEADENGFRGALLLKKGIYEIESSIRIDSSGIVIRGEGQGNFKKLLLDPINGYDLNEFRKSLEGLDATILIATGEERRTLISVSGDKGIKIDQSTGTEIIDSYVPVGSKTFRVKNPEIFKEGDKIVIQRIGNADWISEIGMDNIPQSPVDQVAPTQWKPFNMIFENNIISIDGDIVTVEKSIYAAIEKKWGGGKIIKYDDKERISLVGIENLRGISFWKPDEFGVDHTNHADGFIFFNNLKNSWIQDITLEHFFSLYGAVNIWRGAKQITIKNSSSLIADEKYYIGPRYRSDRINVETNVNVGRYGFRLQGQSTLVMDCYTKNNRRSFVVGSRVSGPNVFLNCEAENSIAGSEPHHGWSVGGLYDNIDDDIAFMNRLYYGGGHGWSCANYVAWNTRRTLINEKPPTAQNWSIGHKGKKKIGHFRDYSEEGYWGLLGQYVLPRSLYIQQLIDRKGNNFDNEFFFNSVELDINSGSIENYPNPADYFTIFSYLINEPSEIILSVFSIDGRKLAMVDYGEKEAGSYQVFWETTDDNGKPLANGAYIYRLRVNGRNLSNKLLISR